MIHDEKTTEIEIPTSNIVRVKFTENRTTTKPTRNPATAVIPKSKGHTHVLEWIKDLDIDSPWIIRLLAVLSILILSMLVL